MKKYKIYVTIFTILLVLIYAGFSYVEFLNSEKMSLQKKNYTLESDGMRKRVSAMIHSKQSATLAMALSLARDEKLIPNIQNNQISKNYYKNLIEDFQKDTDYKNIWVHILNKDLISLYRSWSPISGDNISEVRMDLVKILKKKEVAYTISKGKFTLSIKAIVPLLKNDEVIGAIEVISHFNSISKQLKKFDIDSVVVLDKQFSKELEHPFTNTFIGDYYIANLDISKSLLSHLHEHNIEDHITSSYLLDGGYIICSKELKNLSGEVLGHYIMLKKITDIPDHNLDFFMFKWLAFALLLVMAIAGVINIVLFYFIRKQKHYYKNIIDSSTNMVIINNNKKMISANRAFFKYFDKYKSVEAFQLEHTCICKYFVEEESYIQGKMDGVFWVDYLLKNQEKTHKVKIKNEDKVYYFLVSASVASEDDEYFSVVFAEITNEENYKKELEILSVTDELTGLSNRRHFEKKTKDEISSSIRYQYALSFIMLDIDYFKRVNDIHGHGVGDTVLIEYTKLISSILRDSDVFSRIGGEEFMIILPHANINDAELIAEKLRESVEKYKQVIPITMSFGVTQYIKGEDISYILKRVDDALYEAKESGRNRVVAK